MTDAQGKTFSTALLRMEIEISDDEARSLGQAWTINLCKLSRHTGSRMKIEEVNTALLEFLSE